MVLKTLFMSLFEKRRARSRVDVLSTAVKNTEQGRAGDSERQRRVIRKFQLIKQPLKLHSSSL